LHPSTKLSTAGTGLPSGSVTRTTNWTGGAGVVVVVVVVVNVAVVVVVVEVVTTGFGAGAVITAIA